jgi:hypothetical protein
MKGLLLRLSMVDADAEAAVRVIAYFDALVEQRATLGALVRSVAALAECPAGLVRPGAELRLSPEGKPVPSGQPIAESGGIDLGETGRVWLERAGAAGPLDDLVLERFAMSARVLARLDTRGSAPNLADPALVELILAERAAVEDRARALRLLGLEAALPVRVLAVSAPGRDAGAEAVGLVARGRPLRAVRVAVVDATAAVLLQPRVGAMTVVEDLRAALTDRAKERGAGGSELRVGVGGPVPPLQARDSWLEAQLALRFAVPGAAPDAVIEHTTLGALTLLADLPPARLRAEPDVAALLALAETESGALDVDTLEAFCRSGSLRQAAVILHLHHSSVAARLAHVEDALGWRLDEPQGRFRARMALLARRLAL